MKGKRKDKIQAYSILCLLGIIFLIPLCWVIFASFDAQATVSMKKPVFTIQNYVDLFTNISNYKAFGNGLIVSLGSAFLVVVLAGLMAYPLSRYQMKHKKSFMLTMLFMTCLPITTVMVPVYRLFIMLGLYDTLGGLILFMTASNLPYAVWMMKNFMDSVPVELEEAAWIDGAGRLKGMIKVIVPLMKAGVCSVGIFIFSNCWGNFLTPFILLSTAEKMPASVTLYRFFGSHTVSYGLLAAFSIAYAVPSIVLYALSQRYMSQGFTMEGGAKG